MKSKNCRDNNQNKKCKEVGCKNSAWCKLLCRLHYSRIWNDEHREQTRESGRNSYRRHRLIIKERRQTTYKYFLAKSTAKTRGRVFNLTKKHYYELINRGCYYCEKPIKEVGINLDRIDNSKDYIKGNVLPCCGRDNRLRSDIFTVKETKIMVKALEKSRK